MTGVRDPSRATPASREEQAVTSRDGTPIAFDRMGDGPTVILVGAATMVGQGNGALAEALASELTVLSYDRRGRGGSGDTPTYAVQREIEDIDALIAAAGGSAHLFGISSGGALALEAAPSWPASRRRSTDASPTNRIWSTRRRWHRCLPPSTRADHPMLQAGFTEHC